MTVAVVGTGFIGGTLGRAFAAAGIPTVFGTRNPQDTGVAEDSGAAVASIADAVSRAETVVLTMPGGAVEDFLHTHRAALAGTLIVDAANSMGAPVAHHAALVAKHVPRARYARAFNSLGGENFADPTFAGTAGDLFFSSTKEDRPAVQRLVSAVGLRPMYIGENQYDLLDGVTRLWFALAVEQGLGRHLAFRTLTDAD